MNYSNTAIQQVNKISLHLLWTCAIVLTEQDGYFHKALLYHTHYPVLQLTFFRPRGREALHG